MRGMRRRALALLLGSMLAGCVGVPVKTEPGTAPAALPPVTEFEPVAWNALPGWREDDVAAAWPSLLANCRAPRMPPAWADFCRAAAALDARNAQAPRALIESRLRAWRITTRSQDRKHERRDQGLITGYYEPVLQGSRKRGGRFQTPLYGVPDDLVSVELGESVSRAQGRAHPWPPAGQAHHPLSRSHAARGWQGAGRQGDRVGRQRGRRILPADPGLGKGAAGRGRHPAAGLCRCERPSVSRHRALPGRSR